MKKVVFAAVALALATLGWLAVFEAINRQMVDYQECGGRYCAPIDNGRNK
jgi:hypothetical protein